MYVFITVLAKLLITSQERSISYYQVRLNKVIDPSTYFKQRVFAKAGVITYAVYAN